MTKTKIEWTDMTWNPVWGCLNEGECKEYCYARRMAKRIGKQIANKEINYLFDNHQSWPLCLEHNLREFEPTWIESNFVKKFPEKPYRIFIGSMNEIYYCKPEWVLRVLNRIDEYPQHTFQFLTKFPEVYLRYHFPKNCHLGVTVTKQKEVDKLLHTYLPIKNKMFVSIEPILEEINLFELRNFDWVIVGAETGYRKDKVIPKSWWLKNIGKNCFLNKIPLFEKDNLKKAILEWKYEELIQEFPRDN